jgi:hypothetical protein
LPSIRSSKSVSFRFETERPFASRTETGIGTSVDSTRSISSFGVGVTTTRGRGVGAGVGLGVENTDGPVIRVGVGVGVGFVRPDCASVLPANGSNSTKEKMIMRKLNKPLI